MKLSSLVFLFSVISLMGMSPLAAQQPTTPKTTLLKSEKSTTIVFRDAKTGLYGYKDAATDKVVIPCKYVFAYSFSDGLAAVNMGGKLGFDKEYTNDYFVKGGKWGYINISGKIVIPCKYDGADLFYDGLAIVDMKEKKAFIDKTGKEITPFKYDFINPFSEGLAAVGGGTPLRFSYIDKTGKEVITGDYEAAGNFFKGKARVTRYGAIFFINIKGERVK